MIENIGYLLLGTWVVFEVGCFAMAITQKNNLQLSVFKLNGIENI